MIRLAVFVSLVVVGLAVAACVDNVPKAQQTSKTTPEQQVVEEPESIDDSLCFLLDPLINRRSFTQQGVVDHEAIEAIERGATINARCSDGFSPLHLAAAHRGVRVVELLLEFGADVDAVNSAGETPLIYAAGAGAGLDSNSPSLERLLSAGADINATQEYGQSALHVAALAGKPDALATLLEHEPVLETGDSGGRTALHYAAIQTATAEPVRLLLGAGLDPNATSTDGTTPLHFAANNGSAEASQLLLEAGADANPINEVGMSPLHYAAPEGGAALIRVLLEHGADPNIRDAEGRTALHIAARQNPLSAVAELLLDAGADVSVEDRHGNTACDVLSRYLSDPEVRQRICDLN